MILLTLGTGVGGGIIVDGELVNGVNSFGSECGHIIVDSSATAQLCVWGGGRGQLEAYASASGVVQRTRQRLTEGATSSLSGLLGGENNELTAKRVYQAAVEGDELALEIVDDTARWLGIGVTTLVHTLDSGSVVLGGAMNFGGQDSPIGQRFLQGIIQEFKQRTFENVFEGTNIKFATLGADEVGSTELPEHVGPYRVEALLGEGGAARVFAGRLSGDAPAPLVAIKVLRPDTDGVRVRRRFLAEREIVAGLQHPGIARFVEVHLSVIEALKKLVEPADFLVDHLLQSRRDVHVPCADGDVHP